MVSLLHSVIRLWALAGGVVLLGIVLLTAVNAAGFTLDLILGPFGVSVGGVSGYEDAVELFIGAAALAMFPYCQLQKGNVSVDIFMEMAPYRLQAAIDFISDIVLAVIAFYIGYMTIYGGIEAYEDGATSPILALPFWPFFIPAVFSCFLWALAALITAFTPMDETGEKANG